MNANCWVMITRNIWETRQNPLGKNSLISIGSKLPLFAYFPFQILWTTHLSLNILGSTYDFKDTPEFITYFRQLCKTRILIHFNWRRIINGCKGLIRKINNLHFYCWIWNVKIEFSSAWCSDSIMRVCILTKPVQLLLPTKPVQPCSYHRYYISPPTCSS